MKNLCALLWNAVCLLINFDYFFVCIMTDTVNNKNRQLGKESPSMIECVYETKNNEKTWLVKLVNGEKKWISKRTIKRKKMIDKDTLFVVDRLGAKARYEPGKEFRIVFWKGFKKHTREPINFSPNIQVINNY